jgi:Ulp1 family protease
MRANSSSSKTVTAIEKKKVPVPVPVDPSAAAAGLQSCGVYTMSKLLVTYHDIDIYERDIYLFKQEEWLNDACINFCLKRTELAASQQARVLLMDAAVVAFMRFQVDDEDEVEELAGNLGVAHRAWILAPVNDCTYLGGSSSHWSLLAYHVQSGSSYHLDSSNQFNKVAAEKTAAKLSSLCGR